MSSPPDLPAFCLSDKAVRVGDSIETTLSGIERALSLLGGTVAERMPYSVIMVCCGVKVRVAAFRVLGADYLEVDTKAGSSFQQPSTANWNFSATAAAWSQPVSAHPRVEVFTEATEVGSTAAETQATGRSLGRAAVESRRKKS